MPYTPEADCQVRVYPDAEALPMKWQGLFDLAEEISPELSRDWFGHLGATVFPEPGACEYHALTAGGEPAAILPIHLLREGRLTNVEALANYYTSLFSPILGAGVRAEHLAALSRGIEARHPAAIMQFAPMDPDAPGFGLLRSGLTLAGWRVFDYACFGNWYLPACDLSWESYHQSLPGRLRGTLERKGRRFAAAGGGLKLFTSAGPDLELAIAAYQRVYSASWKTPEPYPGFMPGLLRLCARRGWLRLGVAFLGETPIAAQVWLVCRGKAFIYKLAYDEAHAGFSPGTLLTGMLMRHVLDQDRVVEVDYQTGDDAYKRDWMRARRERRGLVAYNPRRLAGLIGLLREGIGRAGKWGLLRLRGATLRAGRGHQQTG